MLRSTAVALLAAACLASVTAVSHAADDEGFEPLFDGKSLAGWIGAVDGYYVAGEKIVCPADGGGNLYTADDYDNFVIRLDYKLTPGANNGIGLRTPVGEGQPAFVGMEIQILDDTSPQYDSIHDYQHNGSLYGVAAAEQGHLKPVGEWNSMEVVCDKRHVKVTLNGAVVVDADIDEASKEGTIDGREHPGLARETGKIALCGHGTHVEFRNLLVKRLGN